MKDFNIEERVKKAVENFESGYNCAQSVFLAYADVFELDLETAKSMSVSFGGGMGRMREVCGTVSAMAMLAGFRYPVVDPKDQDARTRNYAIVQRWAVCSKSSSVPSSAVNYYLLRKRPRQIRLLLCGLPPIIPVALADAM